MSQTEVRDVTQEPHIPGLSKHRIYTLGAAGSCSLLGFFISILATVSRCTSSGPSAKRRARAQAKNWARG